MKGTDNCHALLHGKLCAYIYTGQIHFKEARRLRSFILVIPTGVTTICVHFFWNLHPHNKACLATRKQPVFRRTDHGKTFAYIYINLFLLYGTRARCTVKPTPRLRVGIIISPLKRKAIIART